MMTARVESKIQPKFSYAGVGHQWVCHPCERAGGWTSEAEAQREANQHNQTKHENEEK
jgi:hypothetical protein